MITQSVTIHVLESVDLDLVSLNKAIFLQEFSDVVTLVTLKLKNLSVLLVLHYVAVASEILFAYLEDFLLVKFIWDTLNSS